MPSSETPARDAVLVKYLNEAYGKEKQLEVDLQRLIGLASDRKPLKKAFQDHLKVTKNQGRELQKRVRALGGKPGQADIPGPDAAAGAVSAGANLANRALAAAKGPIATLRGTGEADNLLRNVRDAFWNEAEEIAHYNVIEAVATRLNDRETVALAKQFRRQEERMQKLLGRQIDQLVKAVIREEVPASERRSPSRRRRRSSTRRASTASRASSSRSSSRSASRSTSSSSSSSRRSAAQKAAATRNAKAARSSARSATTSARTTAKKAGTAARKTGRAARSTAKRATS